MKERLPIMSNILRQLRHNPLFGYGVIGIIIYCILTIIYTPITLGLDVEDITILAVPTIVGLFLFQYFLGHTLLHRSFIGHGIVAILWAVTFPILFHWSYIKPLYFYEFANDFLFGLVLFIGMFLLQYIFTIPQRYPRIIAAIFAIISLILSEIPLLQIGYYVSTWHCLTPASLMALYMTNPEEAWGFLKNTAGILGLVGIGIFQIVYLLFLYWCHKQVIHIVDLHTTRPIRTTIATILSVLFIICAPIFLFPKTCIISNWGQVIDYVKQMQQYNTNHHQIFDSFQLSTKTTAAQTVPGTVILVIGESGSRDYMKVYNPNFPYEDTPWQSEMSHNPNFTFFDKAYSSYPQTVPSLERALTERNQYDDKPFLESVSILDVAKKAGYTTTWFSNQGVYGEYDTAISLIAKTSDTAKWAHESYAFSDRYDGYLLPLLKEVDPTKNNFIVIHIMGSHIYYNDRYPSEFSKWKKGPVPEGLEAYANSQLYTDWLLQSIYTYAQNNLNLQAMIYFSDHGESVDKSHNPDNFDFTMVRIPFWMYLSPAYRANYPNTIAALNAHQHEYFTNDLLYDALVGILHAPSDHYDKTRDFSDPSYRFNLYNLTTLLGTQPLTNDPN